jgi:hypothetical protein
VAIPSICPSFPEGPSILNLQAIRFGAETNCLSSPKIRPTALISLLHNHLFPRPSLLKISTFPAKLSSKLGKAGDLRRGPQASWPPSADKSFNASCLPPSS